MTAYPSLPFPNSQKPEIFKELNDKIMTANKSIWTVPFKGLLLLSGRVLMKTTYKCLNDGKTINDSTILQMPLIRSPFYSNLRSDQHSFSIAIPWPCSQTAIKTKHFTRKWIRWKEAAFSRTATAQLCRSECLLY